MRRTAIGFRRVSRDGRSFTSLLFITAIQPALRFPNLAEAILHVLCENLRLLHRCKMTSFVVVSIELNVSVDADPCFRSTRDLRLVSRVAERLFEVVLGIVVN